MKNILLLIIFIVACTTNLHAQNPLVKQWDKRFGGTDVDGFNSFQQTTDGGFILGGWSKSGISGDKTQPSWGSYYDYWIVKIDSLGLKQWDKRFGGTNDDYLYSVQQTTDGGYILGGYSWSGLSGDKTQPSWGNADYWIVKIDSLGIKQWDKRLGGTGDDELHSLQQTTDGGYILGGISNSGIGGDKTQPSWGSEDYWIVKIDSLGIIQWDKRFGGMGYDYLCSLEQTTDGGYILGGYSSSGTGGDKTQPSWGGSFDYWIVKIDSLGIKQWDKRFGGTLYDYFYSLKQTTDGEYILGGYSNSGISGNKTQPSWGGGDYWIVKINSLGMKKWDKRFGGTSDEELYNIFLTSDGGYIISGDSYSSISGDKTENNLGTEQTWVVKTDSLGNTQWDKTIFTTGHDENGLAIQTKDGCYAMSNVTAGGIGGDKTQPSQGSFDYWIIKFCDSTLAVIPTVNLAASDTNLCETNCIDFTDISTNNPTSWQWTFNGANITSSTLQNPKGICYNTNGNYDVTLIACNSAGCDTLTINNFIIVDAIPTINLGIDTTICIGDSMLLDAGAGFASYLWSNNSTTQTITVASPGVYTVQITSGNCVSTDTVIVNFIPCALPVVSLASSDTILCEKQSINFFDLSLNNPTSWQWYFPGAQPDTSSLQNPTGIYYPSYGQFDVSLKACNAGGCDSLFFPNFISVLQNPPAPTVTVNGSLMCSSPAFAYAWYETSNLTLLLSTSQCYQPTVPGNYFLIIADSNGCSTPSATIAITSMQNENNHACILTYNGSQLLVQGNCITDSESSVYIYDAQGKEIYTTQLSSSSVNLPITNNGIYFYRVVSHGVTSQGKFSFQK